MSKLGTSIQRTFRVYLYSFISLKKTKAKQNNEVGSKHGKRPSLIHLDGKSTSMPYISF